MKKGETKIRVLHNLHPIDTAVGDVGVTLRNGNKWADADGTIALCVCGPAGSECGPENIVGEGAVLSVWSGRFYDVPARLIESEHEESSRLYSGLLRSMRRAYGADWAESSPVVALIYQRLS